MSENEKHFCMPMEAEVPTTESDPQSGSRGFVLDEFKWQPFDTITLRFMGGDPRLQARVRAVAEEWLQHANLRFDWRTEGKTDIRIAFIKGDGSWSLLGKACRKVGQKKPTMNFGWLKPDSPDDELRRVVLHEFGHALGMIHEHQNPIGGVKWNRPAVIADLSGPPNKWSKKTIERNMFKKYDPDEGTGTAFDPQSIMLYPIPKSWTLDGFSTQLNKELSQDDIQLMRTVYPG
jgi:serralysin